MKSLDFNNKGERRWHVNLLELVNNVSQIVSFREETSMRSYLIIREGRVTMTLIYPTTNIAYLQAKVTPW